MLNLEASSYQLVESDVYLTNRLLKPLVFILSLYFPFIFLSLNNHGWVEKMGLTSLF